MHAKYLSKNRVMSVKITYWSVNTHQFRDIGLQYNTVFVIQLESQIHNHIELL